MPRLPSREDAGELELLVVETPPVQVLEQRVPALRGEADAELRGRVLVEAAPAEELLAGRGPGGGELFEEEFRGGLVRVEQALAAAHLFAARAGAAVLVVQLEADARGQASRRPRRR